MASSPGNTGPSELRANDDNRMDGFEKASFIAIIVLICILALLGFIIALVRGIIHDLRLKMKEQLAIQQIRAEIDRLEREIQTNASA